MKVSTKARYGIRAMIEMAINGTEKPVMAKEIASKQRISKKYLEQILTILKENGFIRTIRGSRGGYILSKSPESISLKEIFEALEGPIEFVDCVGSMKICPMSENCPARDVWVEMSKAVSFKLKEMTLADLVKRANQERCTGGYIYYI